MTNLELLFFYHRTRYAHDTPRDEDPASTPPSLGHRSGNQEDIARRDSVQSSRHKSVGQDTVSTENDTPGAVPSEPTSPPTTPAASTSSRDTTAQDSQCPSDIPCPSQLASHFPTSTPAVNGQIHTLVSSSTSYHTSNVAPAASSASVPGRCELHYRSLHHISPSLVPTSISLIAPSGTGQCTMASTTDTASAMLSITADAPETRPVVSFFTPTTVDLSMYEPIPSPVVLLSLWTLLFQIESSVYTPLPTLDVSNLTPVLMTTPLIYLIWMLVIQNIPAASGIQLIKVLRYWMSGAYFATVTLRWSLNVLHSPFSPQNAYMCACGHRPGLHLGSFPTDCYRSTSGAAPPSKLRLPPNTPRSSNPILSPPSCCCLGSTYKLCPPVFDTSPSHTSNTRSRTSSATLLYLWLLSRRIC